MLFLKCLGWMAGLKPAVDGVAVSGQQGSTSMFNSASVGYGHLPLIVA
jgi:hypothetical protein